MYVNPAFERLSGYPAAELLGRNCRFLQGQDQDQPSVRELRQAITEGQTITVTLRNYRKDGTFFHNELTLSPMHDDAGVVTHYVGFQNDVTLREEDYLRKAQNLQQSEQNQRLIAGALQRTLDLSLDLITSIDADDRFVTINAACTSLLGYTPEELLGRRFLDFVHLEDQAMTRSEAALITNPEVVQNAGERTTALFQNRYVHKNGRATAKSAVR